MDAREAQSFLAGAGAVGGHLDQEIERGDLKVEQTVHDIHRLQMQAARLRTIKRQAEDRLQATDALMLVQAVGDCLVQLESTIALMEAKNDVTEANVAIARQCQAALDKYGNNLASIPKSE